MTGPRRLRAIHKVQRFSRMRSGHPAVTEDGAGRRGRDNSAEVGAGTYQIQSLVISCIVSAVSGHPLHYVRSLWSSPVLCSQSLVISCTMSAVSGHLLYYVRSLWSSPVLCPQALVISCTMSAVHWFRIFFFLFPASKI
ncbi:unnamed protein product, partial [Staurois parvus]